jgi:cell division protein FtsB
MPSINIDDKATIEALQYALSKVLNDMKETKMQNIVLQKRNTELVEENRKLKKQIKDEHGTEFIRETM